MNQRADETEARLIYKIACEGDRRFVIYNARELGNPADHEPDKWYCRPYPVPVGLDYAVCFDSAADAERAARQGMV